MSRHTGSETLLGTYLRDRRAKLDPAAFGFAPKRRRTPGLRREEVAQRANISPTWYTWLEQGRGGSIVFVASKNALVAGANAAAYSSAKAASLHLGRCLAEEGGPHGIRVNTVNPDAVIQGSSIWSSDWKAERAGTYGVDEDELQTFYQGRTKLGVAVLPEDVAEAIAFLAGPKSAKSTGNILNVDGGVTAAYPR